MDVIKIKNAAEVTTAYAKFGVSEKRIEGLNSKFVSIPDEFKVTGLTAREATIQGETRVIPEFAIEANGVKNSIPVGQLFAQYCGDTNKASEITKEGSAYKGRYLVSNNKRVNSFAEGLSEAEFVVACMGKSFKAEPAKDYPVYSGFVAKDNKNVLEFHATPEEAIAAIKPKSYRAVNFA